MADQRERQCSQSEGHGPHGWREGPDDRSPMLYCRGVGLWAAPEQEVLPEAPIQIAPPPLLSLAHREVHKVLADGGKCPHCGFVAPVPAPTSLSVEQEIRARAILAAAAMAGGGHIDRDKAEYDADTAVVVARVFARYIDVGVLL